MHRVRDRQLLEASQFDEEYQTHHPVQLVSLIKGFDWIKRSQRLLL
jgi:hypothetical protein